MQRQRMFLSWCVLFTVVLLVCCLTQKNYVEKAAKQKVKTTTAKIEKAEVSKDAAETETETEEQKVRRVRAEAVQKGYSDALIEILDKNPETADFIDNYDTKRNKPPAETIGDSLTKGVIPHLIQWDERWGYTTYGTSILAISGCGPTCMAMVVAGLTGDPTVTPAKVAAYGMENGYVDEENNTYWRFMDEAASNWNISCYDAMLTEEQVRDELQKGKPIICSLGPGDFTQYGHFIVLTGYQDGKVTIRDPFSIKRTEKEWVFAEIVGQMKSMWVYSMD